ncbi:hypothetical protein [Photobacterium galatheae]|uniref:Uncharacterized protein n=1 Tax=Photobacterium galatheae TaxID=1654360 RepID=A0A066RUS7_9GAMM|nr:hypothetical protein [Photobacterium galatheae]KDM92866.1 hypothetical protein EA58_03675 [Photobacterium galatheae]MCM0148169.1 hypothetical protein [Photobacterium galatheae]
MVTIYETQHGAVTVSAPYFSFVQCREVISLTLIKDGNQGWGVSKEFRADTEISPEFFQLFALEASRLL